MTTLKQLIAATIIGSTSMGSVADIAIIINKDNDIATMDTQEIRSFYLGKRAKFSNGDAVTPLDQDAGSDIQTLFSQKVLRKSPSSLNSYWSRQMFSGKGTPPTQIKGGDNAVIDAVINNKKAIAYIDASNVNPSVKVLLTIKQ